MDALQISRTGMDVEWQRLEVIAQNLANMNTTRTADGTAYQPVRLISGPKGGFANHLRDSDPVRSNLQGVEVFGIEPVASGVRRVYEPQHPHADPDGFVTYPKVDHAAEMTLLIKAARVYEANLSVFSIAQEMYTRAAELGRQG